MGLFKSIFDYETKELKKIDKLVDEIEALDLDMQKLKDKDFKSKTKEFKERLEKGETLDDILEFPTTEDHLEHAHRIFSSLLANSPLNEEKQTTFNAAFREALANSALAICPKSLV